MIEQIRRKFPYFFVILILLILLFQYFVEFKLVWIDLQPSSTAGIVFFLIVYHVSLLMLVWSLIKTMGSEPGKVPTFWGYFMTDPDTKKRKYCIICHTYKPERTHHCSTCNKCVLNMDHHCPWINNCIGFYNRKFFILMLFYTTLTCFLQAIGIIAAVPAIVKQIQNEAPASSYFRNLIIIIAFVFNMVVLVTIVIFLKFHIELILSNTTTIETLQFKRSGSPEYNIGKYYNWLQVFGKNAWMWPFPIFCENDGPAGDGVIWPRKNVD